MHLLQDVCRQQNTTIILSTHDIDVVPIYADVIDVMDQGHVIAHGTPEEIFAQPELLRSHHLRLPRISHLLEILQKRTAGMWMLRYLPFPAQEKNCCITQQTEENYP